MKLFMKYTGLMKMKTRFLTIVVALLMLANAANAQGIAWTNRLKSLFTTNRAIIYSINIRTFGAQDFNGNDIVELDLGERPGTFINAIPLLKDLASYGINTIYLLPITKTGKLSALGNAGSLYALDSFDTLNPQFYDSTDLTPDIKAQAKKFVDEAHRLRMHVMVDLPSMGSYDLALERPELFLKDSKGEFVTPKDWKDVRVFKVYNSDKTLNRALVDEHKKFVDLVKSIGADGIRADVAAIKPKEFWEEIINYARSNDNEFMFLAEASPKWENPIENYPVYTSVEDLLSAGFDGFYSDWSNLNDIKNAGDFMNKIKTDLNIIKKFEGKKSMVANLAGHDQIAPILKGYKYWQLVNWLNTFLPLNPYVLDGFPSADTFAYLFANNKANKTYTDSEYYYLHNGQIDIFNYSRPPLHLQLDATQTTKEFRDAVDTRRMFGSLITSGEIDELKTNNPVVFAFRKVSGNESVVIVGNLDYQNDQKVKVSIPGFSPDDFVLPVKMTEPPLSQKGSMTFVLRPYEIQVLAVRKIISLN